jgi:hypothetical protein
MARHAEVANKLAVYLREADERGDAWTYTNLLALEALGPLLAQGAPREAEQRLGEAESRWSAGQGLNTARFVRVVAATAIDLHQRRADVHARFVARRALLDRGFARVPFTRIVLRELAGRSALASAVSGGDLGMLREAESYARRLTRENVPAAAGFAQLLLAGVYAQRARPALAAGCIEQGIALLQPLGLAQWTLPARIRLDALSAQRPRVCDAPRTQLTKLGVTEVDAFVAMMLPSSL